RFPRTPAPPQPPESTPPPGTRTGTDPRPTGAPAGLTTEHGSPHSPPQQGAQGPGEEERETYADPTGEVRQQATSSRQAAAAAPSRTSRCPAASPPARPPVAPSTPASPSPD